MINDDEQVQALTRQVQRLERRCQRQFWLLAALIVCAIFAWVVWDRFGAKFGRTVRADRVTTGELVLDPDPVDQLDDLVVSQFRKAHQLVENDDMSMVWNGVTISSEPDIRERREFPWKGHASAHIHVKTDAGTRTYPASIDYRYSRRTRGWDVIDWRVSDTAETAERGLIYDAMRAAFGKGARP